MNSVAATLETSRSGWRRALPPLCLFVGLPVLLIAAFTVQLVFAVAIPWPAALRASLHHWIVPFVVLLLGWGVARAFPIERGRLGWAVPVHLIAGALVIALAGRVETQVFPSAPGPRAEG